MNFTENEKKWQEKWKSEKLYSFDKSRLDKKKYVLEMFSYPSGAKLHVGHWYNFGPSDSYARFKRMQGYEVFEPMGFDAFGLPAENYAIKTGIHPEDSTLNNIKTMEKQLSAMGAMFDWDYEVVTCLPEYYKWTQWLFLQLYKNDLAYRKEAPVNWCPSCNTVLANEQVVDGICERCGAAVIKRNLTQWFFRITKYADELLDCLDDLDWPEKTKLMQKNWIGKSTGGEIIFKTTCGESFSVFTTRADTLFGVSYVVLAPEHPLVSKLTTPENKAAIEAYKLDCSKVTEIDRLSTAREKNGIFTGSYAINPINGKKIQIWIADYVLASYGTGAVMGVPSHDERDFAFAKKYNLDITRVIRSESGNNDDLPFTEHGIMCNSAEFDGLTTDEGKLKIIERLAKSGQGELKTNYRLRDWLISRQRYWGAPIPVIHCEKCGAVPVPECDLPVKLPYNVNFKPTGESPLSSSEEFMNVTCPICGGIAKRDPDTLDTFVCSSWYFLRYPDNKNDKEAFNSELINKMLPVDKYIGGAEHACMHLLYARFFTKALRDMGYLNFGEPFKSLVHQGLILGSDGYKMSKSRGNVESPDDYVTEYGSDVFRMYLMFGFSYIEGGPWNADGIKSISKFLERVDRLITKISTINNTGNVAMTAAEKELNFVMNNTIKKVSEDIEILSFNTAIARIMEFVNGIYKYISDIGANYNYEFLFSVGDTLTKILAPFVPHISEEFNEMLGFKVSVFNRDFPIVNEKALIRDEVEIALQINSKLRGKIMISGAATKEEIEASVRVNETVLSLVGDVANIKKIIVIIGRLVNILI